MVAYLPGQSTMEVTFTSVEFNADMFAMANNEDFATQEKQVNPVTVVETVGTGKTIVIKDVSNLKEDSWIINGMEKSIDFTVSQNTPEDGDTSPDYTITFKTDAVSVGADVEIYYEQELTMAVATFDNKKSAFGEVILKYPKKKWAI